MEGFENAKPRTPQDMDGTLTLIFAKSETTWDIITKISASLQLRKKWILTKFGGCSSKNGPARSIRSFRHFWREIQIWRHLEPSYLVQSGYLLRLTTGENLVLISQTTFEKFKFLDFFGRKSKPKASRVFIFGAKKVHIEVNNWWKFGVDISNHFFEIEI